MRRFLLLDPGVVDRVGEFIGFSKDYLQQHSDVDVFTLRSAFSAYLGKKTVYRAMILTEAQAAAIAKDGLQSPGLFFKKILLQSGSMNKVPVLVHDFADRVLKDDGTYRNDRFYFKL